MSEPTWHPDSAAPIVVALGKKAVTREGFRHFLENMPENCGDELENFWNGMVYLGTVFLRALPPEEQNFVLTGLAEDKRISVAIYIAGVAEAHDCEAEGCHDSEDENHKLPGYL